MIKGYGASFYENRLFWVKGFKVIATLIAWDDDKRALVNFEWETCPKIAGNKFKREYMEEREDIVNIFRRLLTFNTGYDYDIMVGVDDIETPFGAPA